jgi:hypothetical protein
VKGQVCPSSNDSFHTYGLAAGWTDSMMGIMTLVRVLPEDKYDNIMAMIKEGKTEKPKSSHDQHKHSG